MITKSKLIFILIVLLAGLLRLYRLADIPPALNWDEASVGYNAFSLLTTESDEYGRPFPLSIRSFNDYKPPIYTYSTAIIMAFLGKTEMAVRFTSALAGLLSVVAMFFLTRTLFLFNSQLPQNPQTPQKLSDLLAFSAAFLIAVSPWHIQFSRIAFEASLALFFFVFGFFLLIKFLNKPKLLLILGGVVSLILSVYSHHSVKIFFPLFLGFFCLSNFRQLWKNRGVVLVSFFFGLVLLLPIVRNLFFSSGQATRALTVSIFAQPNQFHFSGKPIPQVLAENYLSFFDPSFLVLGRGDNPRHHAPNSGPILLVTLPLAIAGLIFLLIKRPKYTSLIIAWFVLAPIPAIFAIDNPHASRAFLQIPAYALLIALGIQLFLKKIPPPISPIFLNSLISLILIANLFYYFHQYFEVSPKIDGPAWQYGYKEVVQEVQKRQENFSHIYITTAYDQPYIYFLFYGNVDPRIKNDGSFSSGFNKYQFVNFKSMSDSEFASLPSNSLLVLAPDEFPTEAKTLKSIYFPNNQLAFRIVRKI